jgi:histone-lysine N-methyltransferase SETD2
LAANTVSAAVDVQAESSRSRSPSSSRLKTDPDVEHQLDFPAEDEDEKPDFLRKDLLPSAKRSKKKGRGASSSTPPPAPVLIDNLPTAWDEAHDSFGTLERCVYEHKNLGLSREQDEMMVCDCIYDRGESPKTSLRWPSSRKEAGIGLTAGR